MLYDAFVRVRLSLLSAALFQVKVPANQRLSSNCPARQEGRIQWTTEHYTLNPIIEPGTFLQHLRLALLCGSHRVCLLAGTVARRQTLTNDRLIDVPLETSDSLGNDDLLESNQSEPFL